MITDCIFCKIINGEMPSTKVYEDDDILAFNDIFPSAETHVLVIPKKHIESLAHLQDDDEQLMGKLTLAIPKIAKQLGLKGWKTLFNTGAEGGQLVFHIHAHILGGKFNKSLPEYNI